jgi:glycosyltransferase involved in cell wall biosynthesis
LTQGTLLVDIDCAEKRPKGLVAIIPCYNAGSRVRPVAEGALVRVVRLIIVDDGSTDGSAEALRDLPLEILTLPVNQGKGFALLAGFREALKDPLTVAVCVLDADGQHDPAEIPALYRGYQESGADLVIGSRVFEGGHIPWRSRFGNKVTVTVTALLLGHWLPDTQCGFRILSRAFAERVVATVAGGRYETEMEIIVRAIREGRQTASVPIRTIYEAGNASSHFRKFHDSYRIYSRLLRAAWFSGRSAD